MKKKGRIILLLGMILIIISETLIILDLADAIIIGSVCIAGLVIVGIGSTLIKKEKQ